jgi:hypothetical protein
MHLIFQKEKPRAEQGDSSTWVTALTQLTNGVILIISTVLKNVMSSAVEAEIGAVFINAKEGEVLHTTLE